MNEKTNIYRTTRELQITKLNACETNATEIAQRLGDLWDNYNICTSSANTSRQQTSSIRGHLTTATGIIATCTLNATECYNREELKQTHLNTCLAEKRYWEYRYENCTQVQEDISNNTNIELTLCGKAKEVFVARLALSNRTYHESVDEVTKTRGLYQMCLHNNTYKTDKYEEALSDLNDTHAKLAQCEGATKNITGRLDMAATRNHERVEEVAKIRGQYELCLKNNTDLADKHEETLNDLNDQQNTYTKYVRCFIRRIHRRLGPL